MSRVPASLLLAFDRVMSLLRKYHDWAPAYGLRFGLEYCYTSKQGEAKIFLWLLRDADKNHTAKYKEKITFKKLILSNIFSRLTLLTSLVGGEQSTEHPGRPGSLFVFMWLQRVSAKVLAEADFGGKALTGLLSPVEAEGEGASRNWACSRAMSFWNAPWPRRIYTLQNFCHDCQRTSKCSLSSANKSLTLCAKIFCTFINKDI